jgi:hypothetical protein
LEDPSSEAPPAAIQPAEAAPADVEKQQHKTELAETEQPPESEQESLPPPSQTAEAASVGAPHEDVPMAYDVVPPGPSVAWRGPAYHKNASVEDAESKDNMPTCIELAMLLALMHVWNSVGRVIRRFAAR